VIIETVNIYEGKGGRGGGWQKVYFHLLLTSKLDRGERERGNSCPGGCILGGITLCSF